MLLNRRAKTFDYPNWSTAHWQQIRVPKPGNGATEMLAAAWGELKDEDLQPLHSADTDPVRRAIDAAAAEACGIEETQMASWRRRLARVPIVSNKPANKAGDHV